jgi:hypothetical protein
MISGQKKLKSRDEIYQLAVKYFGENDDMNCFELNSLRCPDSICAENYFLDHVSGDRGYRIHLAVEPGIAIIDNSKKRMERVALDTAVFFDIDAANKTRTVTSEPIITNDFAMYSFWRNK